MKSVLCYGDSNTWGANPVDISRFARPVRYTGVLQRLLGDEWVMIEEGLPNRTSGFEDPLIPLRSGLALFPMILESHSPMEVVAVMLGTNDCKTRIGRAPEETAEAIGEIGRIAREQGAQVLLIAPPPMRWPIRYEEFTESAVSNSQRFAALYRQQSERIGAAFLDAGEVMEVSPLDGVHFDAAGHALLAQAICDQVRILVANPLLTQQETP